MIAPQRKKSLKTHIVIILMLVIVFILIRMFPHQEHIHAPEFAVPVPKAPLLLAAIGINASTCHLPPLLIVIDTRGEHTVYEYDDVTPELLASVRALPDSHIATLKVPCEDKPSPTSSHDIPRSVCGTDQWAESNPYLWEETHCSNIAYTRVADRIPDGSAPMSPEHRAQRDPQGHLDASYYSKLGFCSGHVASVLVQPTGALLIACYAAKVSP